VALTDIECRTAKPREKPYSISDAGGLKLLVAISGTKAWRMNVRLDGRLTTLTLGRYPDLSLAEARRKRDEIKGRLREGLLPDGTKPVGQGQSFGEVAQEWLAAHKDVWTRQHMARLSAGLERDVLPHLGPMDVRVVTPPVVLGVLRKVEARGAAVRARQFGTAIGQIMRFAVATGRAERDPTPDLRGALKPRPRVKHHPTLAQRDMPAFFARLKAADADPRAKLGLMIVAHTFVRSKELLGGVWSEVEGDLWRIPAERMKMSRGHVVPLSPEVQALMAELKRIAPGERMLPIVQHGMLGLLHQIGYRGKMTVHGFRATASTILNESGLWRPDAIERQLAHVPGDGVRAAYNAAQYMAERREMMCWYSRLLAEAGARV
jgi:integrase